MMRAFLDRVKPWVPKFLARRWFERGASPAGKGEAAEIFREVYRLNAWGSAESKSGVGSTLVYTKRLREELGKFLRERGVRRMVDLPCGDFNWMRMVDLTGIEYFGLDVVPELIEANERVFGGPGREFRVCNGLRESPPKADLIFCRDLLIHFSYADALRLLRGFQASGSEWLLTTSYRERVNRNEPTGGFYRVNLEAWPFEFGSPEAWLGDEGTREGTRGKILGLWNLGSLDLSSLARAVEVGDEFLPGDGQKVG